MKNKEERIIFVDADGAMEMQNQLDEKVNPLIRNDGWTIKHITSSNYGRHIYAFFILERKRIKKLNE